MGTLKIKGMENLKAKKLDPNDPKIKELIESSIKEQEKILKLKNVSRESMRLEITI